MPGLLDETRAIFAWLAEALSPDTYVNIMGQYRPAYEVGAIERTGRFEGVYHVLGGHLSPLDGIGPEDLNVQTLFERIRDANGGVSEVIVATNASVEGEATAVYLETMIRPLGPRVTRLARGIPVGSDLEYVDGTTIAEALSGRRAM